MPDSKGKSEKSTPALFLAGVLIAVVGLFEIIQDSDSDWLGLPEESLIGIGILLAVSGFLFRK